MAGPPQIVPQPADQANAVAGRHVTVTAGATGLPAAVRWRVSTDGGVTFTDVPRATKRKLKVVAEPKDSGCLYRAVFANAVGRSVARAAPLVVS